MNHKVDIYDTTLRDGTQAENFNLSVEDRVRISLKLDELGIDFIEGGWPGSNPSAVEFFKIMQGQTLKHAKLTAFGSTRNFNKPVDKDPETNRPDAYLEYYDADQKEAFFGGPKDEPESEGI